MARKPKSEQQKAYEKANFHNQNVCFPIAEMEEINEYCKEKCIAKNRMIRDAVAFYMENHK